MSRHVEGRQANSSALSETDPKTVRFEDSFDVCEAEQAAVWRKNCERAKIRLSEPPQRTERSHSQRVRASEPP